MNATDAGKRVADEYALHRLADEYGHIGKWFAVRLTDGTSDHVLYESKQSAVQHQHHNEDFYAFIQVGPWGMSARDADAFLAVQRRMYDAGLRMADPDSISGGKEVIKRATQEDQRNQIRAMFGTGQPSNISYRK